MINITNRRPPTLPVCLPAAAKVLSPSWTKNNWFGRGREEKACLEESANICHACNLFWLGKSGDLAEKEEEGKRWSIRLLKGECANFSADFEEINWPRPVATRGHMAPKTEKSYFFPNTPPYDFGEKIFRRLSLKSFLGVWINRFNPLAIPRNLPYTILEPQSTSKRS